ncbi:MAG: hypothetical protein JWR54_1043 [Mucilaginibacter sp.]|nr:hypothetical protein [Mucilaginibacter sp.]
MSSDKAHAELIQPIGAGEEYLTTDFLYALGRCYQSMRKSESSRNQSFEYLKKVL